MIKIKEFIKIIKRWLLLYREKFFTIINNKKRLSKILKITGIVTLLITGTAFFSALSGLIIFREKDIEIIDTFITTEAKMASPFIWLNYSTYNEFQETIVPKYSLYFRAKIILNNPIFPLSSYKYDFLHTNIYSFNIIYTQNCEASSITNKSLTITSLKSGITSEISFIEFEYYSYLPILKVDIEYKYEKHDQSIFATVYIKNREPYTVDPYWCFIKIPASLFQQYRLYNYSIEMHGRIFNPSFGIKTIFDPLYNDVNNISIPVIVKLESNEISNIKFHFNMSDKGNLVVWGPEGPLLQPGAIKRIYYDESQVNGVWEFSGFMPPWFNVSIIDMDIINDTNLYLLLSPNERTICKQEYVVNIYLDGYLYKSKTIYWSDNELNNLKPITVDFSNINFIDCYTVAVDITISNNSVVNYSEYFNSIYTLGYYIGWLQEKAPNCASSCVNYMPILYQNGSEAVNFFLFIKGWVMYKYMSGLWGPISYEYTPGMSVLAGRSIGLPMTTIIVEFSDGEIHTDVAGAIPDSDVKLLKVYENVLGPIPVIPPGQMLSFYNVESAILDNIKSIYTMIRNQRYYIHYSP